MSKYVFVTGGVVSSLGKGIAAASLAAILESRGIRVTNIKLDPYINVDPGTMSPYQHGEVFVTDDGAETDLDLGHYERYTSSRLTRNANITTGRIYECVISKERRGEYLGATVQVIPHITDEIKSRIKEATDGADIAIIEIGGVAMVMEGLFMKTAPPGKEPTPVRLRRASTDGPSALGFSVAPAPPVPGVRDTTLSGLSISVSGRF